MWRDIFINNSSAVLEMLNYFSNDLDKLKSAIEDNNYEYLEDFFKKTRDVRKNIIEAAREGGWKWSADYLIGKQLTGTRLGILGMGRIGQKIAKIAKSLGMVIHYHNRSKLKDEKEDGAIYHDSAKSLFSVSE